MGLFFLRMDKDHRDRFLDHSCRGVSVSLFLLHTLLTTGLSLAGLWKNKDRHNKNHDRQMQGSSPGIKYVCSGLNYTPCFSNRRSREYSAPAASKVPASTAVIYIRRCLYNLLSGVLLSSLST